MTLVRDSQAAKAIHALVIGVGEYPWLVGGGKSPLFPQHSGMGQLTSAPMSARAFCNWLMKDCVNPELADKTIDLLLSDAESSTFTDSAGVTHEIERATMENVKQAVLRWCKRGGADSLLIFYFCGHGLGKGKQTVLLTENFGSQPDTLSLTFAIDFDQLYLGLDQAKPRRQCFFIDACRVGTPFALNTLNYYGDPIYPPQAKVAKQPRSAPVFYSSVPGATAYGRKGEPSFFTAAMLAAFRGAGADDVSGSWRVDTDILQRGILSHLKRTVARTVAQSQLSLADGIADPFTLHQLGARPVVPVEVTCKPDIHNAAASLSVLDTAAGGTGGAGAPGPTTPLLYPPPAEGPWNLDLPFGEHLFEVKLPTPAASPPGVTQLIRPPSRRVEVQVI
jgi:caspase domain-containing protein